MRERNYLRPYLAAIGLEVGQPKNVRATWNPSLVPVGKANWPIILISIPAAVSRMLDSMEKAGGSLAVPARASRRCNLVELTAKGREAYHIWKSHSARAKRHYAPSVYSGDDTVCFVSLGYITISGQKRRKIMADLKRLLRYMGTLPKGYGHRRPAYCGGNLI